MPANPDYFTVVCDGIGAIGVDYVDPNTDPDEHPVSAFVWFKPRLPKGYVIWAPGLTPPRGIMLDDIRARFAPEDGKLRTIVAKMLNEKQRIVVTGDPFTLSFDGAGPTANIAQNATPQQVLNALVALPNLNIEDVFVSGTTTGPGVTVDPYTVTFQGQYARVDVPLMTATNATVTAVQEGTSELGVKLVANQALLALDEPLIYDVEFEIPASDNDGLDKDRKVLPFAIAAGTAGQTLDLASVPRLPHRSTLA